MSDRLFHDRRNAGRVLAGLLDHYRGSPDVVVLALPRGGVPLGYEVARALGAPLDVFVVRKLGVPEREELAMGAIATGGVVVLNDDVIRGLNISPEVIREWPNGRGRSCFGVSGPTGVAGRRWMFGARPSSWSMMGSPPVPP
jgi:predicted phosphoribosyltransferase